MKRIPELILILVVVFSCTKKESDDLIWQKTFGEGNAFFVKSSPDSGIIACGTLDNKPYLVKLSEKKTIVLEYQSERKGLFSSVWNDTSCFIAGGNSNGKMLLSRVDNEGNKVWDTLITAGFNIDLTNLSYSGNGKFLAAGTASADSSDQGNAGLLFIRFDTAGQVIENKEISGSDFVSAEKICVDGQGSIFLSVTKKPSGAKTRVSVAKYNSDIQKLWETELYNNPNFAAASFGIIVDEPGNVYVTGKTEVSRESGTLDNSFIASLNASGSVRWKKYLENANSGSALTFNNDLLMMLNRNCFIINMANPDDGADAGRIRMFSVCDPYDTDAKGSSLDLHYDGNVLVAGTKGGSFYLALKPVVQ
jgi:hypothetical protein